ncbi:zinc ABC transporter substrate-binding protein [Acetobacteraceae bacterium ESL0709]|nr:zinc ABC transporter substrate-binding protein [Acetobacteraceae bacterium ESL0697]MDF7677127.1 zinc ABC transporter substrate-binding protein [Acetobacteraceae bacterium ESL0709]
MRLFQRMDGRVLTGILVALSLGISLCVPVRKVQAAASRVSLLCVETVWCDVARQIGGEHLETQVLLTAPGLDPHHFQPSPSLWRSVGQVDGFLVNGATYDDWALSFNQGKTDFLNAAVIGHWRTGEDPHLFFDPAIVKAVAVKLADWLGEKAPQDRNFYQNNLARFENSLNELDKKLILFRQRYQGLPIAITEPAGERLLSRTGLELIDKHWALSVMNQTGVSARETASLEQSVEKRQIHALIVNPLVKSTQINRLLDLAAQKQIPLVMIQESLPSGLKWQDWMSQILDQLFSALDQKR